MAMYLQIATIFWTHRRIICVSCWMYMSLMILGRQKCIQLSH